MYGINHFQIQKLTVKNHLLNINVFEKLNFAKINNQKTLIEKHNNILESVLYIFFNFSF